MKVTLSQGSLGHWTKCNINFDNLIFETANSIMSDQCSVIKQFNGGNDAMV